MTGAMPLNSQRSQENWDGGLWSGLKKELIKRSDGTRVMRIGGGKSRPASIDIITNECTEIDEPFLDQRGIPFLRRAGGYECLRRKQAEEMQFEKPFKRGVLG